MERSTEEIQRMFGDEIEKMGFELVDIKGSFSGKNINIRLFVDKEGGITVDECGEISRTISDLIFRKNLIPKNYTLEVSSPGINRPLKKEKDFKKNIGREVMVEYKENSELKKVQGKIIDVNTDLHLINKKRETFLIPFSEIVKGQIVLKW